MSEQKRNMDFTLGNKAVPAATAPGATGIGESQPWRAPDQARALALWKDGQNAGCDPYNSVGVRAFRFDAA